MELLLYVGISATFLLVISLFLSQLLSARVKNQTIAEVDQQGIAVMHEITQTIRNAENINSPAPGASSASLSLDVSDTSLDPAIFGISGNAIEITEGANSPVSLSNSRVSVSGLVFENLSRPDTEGSIRIEFTLTYNNSSGANEYDYERTFYGAASLR